MDCHVAAAHMTSPLVLRAGNPEHIDFGHAVLAKFVLKRCYKKQFFQLRLVPDIYCTYINFTTRGKVS